MEKIYQNLLEEAKKASEFAYSPYSNFSVGACVLYENDKKYIGCNVENASYGLSLCAERNAISTAIADGEKTNIVAIAIYSSKKQLCLPCGACRQWIQEFKESDDTKIIAYDENDELKIYTIDELLPYGFEL